MEEISLYRKVVEATRTYLGPAAERFIARQVQNHLGKEPEKLTYDDLDRLIDWIRIAISLLTEDVAIIDEYVQQLRALANEPPESSNSRG